MEPPRKSAAAPAAAGRASEGAAKGPVRMSDGTVAGMVSGRELAAEMARKRAADAARFAELGDETTGRGAETVYRDKAGKVVSKGALEAAAKEAREAKEKRWEKPEWGGGLAQQRAQAQRAAEMAREAARPFARSRDDPELDSSLRERVRFGDPMAHLARKRAGLDALPPPVVDAAMARHLQKKSGFKVPQVVPEHSWLRRKLGPPANRYGIRPGRHWDGVDRSNGFEASMFKTRAELAQRSTEAHMWAQSDM